ncbi:uncharacterized protein LOC117705885 [Arvicanthis niloticus]|uniref:uncharacterized protein LOC117705885 n=1 Tax=Arvicanthis niloticus TaxID=61156 RepID=UPI00402BBE6A
MRILCGAPGQSVLDPVTRDARNSGSPIGEINAAQRYPAGQDLRTSEARRPQQESSGRLIPTDPGKGPQQLCPAARPARLQQDSTLEEKAWKRKDAGEQRAYGGRGCYLIVCDWGSCGERPLSPCSQRTLI